MLLLIISKKQNMDNLDNVDNVDITNTDVETTLKYVEKKVDRIKKSKNIKKSEIMTVKAKMKLLESEEIIETFEKELNNDITTNTLSNIKLEIADVKLEILFEQLDKLNEQIKNIVNIEEGLKLYQEMKQLVEIIKNQLNSYKIKLIYI
jgi:hypothetical protein